MSCASRKTLQQLQPSTGIPGRSSWLQGAPEVRLLLPQLGRVQDRYEDVCVVLSPGNAEAWNTSSFRDINPATRNKLYVACSSARGNLTFVPESLRKGYKLS